MRYFYMIIQLIFRWRGTHAFKNFPCALFMLHMYLPNQFCQLSWNFAWYMYYNHFLTSSHYCRIHNVNWMFQIRNECGSCQYRWISFENSLYFSDLEDLKPKNSKAKLVMFGDYDTDGSKTYVEDPYYASLQFW